MTYPDPDKTPVKCDFSLVFVSHCLVVFTQRLPAHYGAQSSRWGKSPRFLCVCLVCLGKGSEFQNLPCLGPWDASGNTAVGRQACTQRRTSHPQALSHPRQGRPGCRVFYFYAEGSTVKEMLVPRGLSH